MSGAVESGYLRPVWHGSVRTGHTVPCCINAGLFILRTHNDAAVPVPKASLFSRPPPFPGGLAGSHCRPHFECCNGALDAQVRVWGVFMWYRLHSAVVAQLVMLNDCVAFDISIRDFSTCRGSPPPIRANLSDFLTCAFEFMHFQLFLQWQFCNESPIAFFPPNEIMFESGCEIKMDQLLSIV